MFDLNDRVQSQFYRSKNVRVQNCTWYVYFCTLNPNNTTEDCIYLQFSCFQPAEWLVKALIPRLLMVNYLSWQKLHAELHGIPGTAKSKPLLPKYFENYVSGAQFLDHVIYKKFSTEQLNDNFFIYFIAKKHSRMCWGFEYTIRIVLAAELSACVNVYRRSIYQAASVSFKKRSQFKSK